MGCQLDGNFLAGSVPHKFIILIVTSFVCLWSINFYLSLQFRSHVLTIDIAPPLFLSSSFHIHATLCSFSSKTWYWHARYILVELVFTPCRLRAWRLTVYCTPNFISPFDACTFALCLLAFRDKWMLFTARRYAGAVYAVALCPSVCPSVSVCTSRCSTKTDRYRIRQTKPACLLSVDSFGLCMWDE